MNQLMKRKPILLLIFLSILATVVQYAALSAIASEKREIKKQDALMYGQSVASAIQLTLENSVATSDFLKYVYSVFQEDRLEHFDAVASQIMADDDVISSMYIAPKGVIQAAYPAEIAPSTIGFAMLEDPEQGPRARLAMESGKVTIAGPHTLVEGGVGLIIRNPAYHDGEFLGFSIVVLNWDNFVETVLANTASPSSRYKFAVWKQAHDETAVTDSDGYIFRNSDEPISAEVDIAFEVPNDTWHLVVEPLDGWRAAGEMLRPALLSVMVSLAVIILCMVLYFYIKKNALLNEKTRESAEREKYAAQLAEALAAAEQANAAKSVFLNNMSHDIRTPMNAILGFARLMERELQDPTALQGHLQKLLQSGEYLLTLINNMLEIARIDSGKETIDEDVVDLLDEKSSVIPLLENEIDRKGIHLTHEMHITHRYISADIGKLQEITMNLLSNAVKYTPEGGSIHISFTEIPCESPGYAAYVNTVSDTGIGMSDAFQKQIFDSFTREHNTTQSSIPGTGLGMSIVKKLVDLMGGTITLASTPGKGTTFRVTLTHRIAEAPTQYLAAAGLTDAPGRVNFTGKRILLAEDNAINAEIAMAILEDMGLAVELAEDGVACVDKVTKAPAGRYDLILMDIQMPNLNGYDATRRIRALPETEKAGIPIIAMTANAFDEDRRKAHDCGMDAHLAKPIELDKLTEALQIFLS